MSSKSESESETQPVCVIETIPIGGDHEVEPREIESEGIPTPAHLRVHRESVGVAWATFTPRPIATCCPRRPKAAG